MDKLKNTLTRRVDEHEQALRGILSQNIKKFRSRKAWSQFTLAAKSDLSTNFLADIEAGNTWVSASTLGKLAKAFGIEAYELLKPVKEPAGEDVEGSDGETKVLLDRYSNDLSIVLQESFDKAVERLRKEYLG